MDKLDKLIELIANSDNEQLQSAFLEWQQEGIERKQKLIDKLDKITSEGNQIDSERGKLPIPYVIKSVCKHCNGSGELAGGLVGCHHCGNY